MDIDNLDALNTDELAELQIMFSLLAKYCAIKQRAMRCRMKGFTPKAIELESKCQAIYDQLTDPYKW